MYSCSLEKRSIWGCKEDISDHFSMGEALLFCRRCTSLHVHMNFEPRVTSQNIWEDGRPVKQLSKLDKKHFNVSIFQATPLVVFIH